MKLILHTTFAFIHYITYNRHRRDFEENGSLLTENSPFLINVKLIQPLSYYYTLLNLLISSKLLFN